MTQVEGSRIEMQNDTKPAKQQIDAAKVARGFCYTMSIGGSSVGVAWLWETSIDVDDVSYDGLLVELF